MLLVTGGAGFIGSNLVAALSERGEKVIVCDRLGQGDKWRNLAHHEVEDIVPPEELPQFLRWAERSEEHTSELQSLMRISYAVFCLKKKRNMNTTQSHTKR